MSRPPDTLQGEFARRPAGRHVERRPGEVLLRLPVAPHVRGEPGETAEEATERAKLTTWWPRVRNKTARPGLAGGYWLWAGRPEAMP